MPAIGTGAIDDRPVEGYEARMTAGPAWPGISAATMDHYVALMNSYVAWCAPHINNLHAGRDDIRDWGQGDYFENAGVYEAADRVLRTGQAAEENATRAAKWTQNAANSIANTKKQIFDALEEAVQEIRQINLNTETTTEEKQAEIEAIVSRTRAENVARVVEGASRIGVPPVIDPPIFPFADPGPGNYPMPPSHPAQVTATGHGSTPAPQRPPPAVPGHNGTSPGTRDTPSGAGDKHEPSDGKHAGTRDTPSGSAEKHEPSDGKHAGTRDTGHEEHTGQGDSISPTANPGETAGTRDLPNVPPQPGPVSPVIPPGLQSPVSPLGSAGNAVPGRSAFPSTPISSLANPAAASSPSVSPAALGGGAPSVPPPAAAGPGAGPAAPVSPLTVAPPPQPVQIPAEAGPPAPHAAAPPPAAEPAAAGPPPAAGALGGGGTPSMLPPMMAGAPPASGAPAAAAAPMTPPSPPSSAPPPLPSTNAALVPITAQDAASRYAVKMTRNTYAEIGVEARILAKKLAFDSRDNPGVFWVVGGRNDADAGKTLIVANNIGLAWLPQKTGLDRDVVLHVHGDGQHIRWDVRREWVGDPLGAVLGFGRDDGKPVDVIAGLGEFLKLDQRTQTLQRLEMFSRTELPEHGGFTVGGRRRLAVVDPQLDAELPHMPVEALVSKLESAGTADWKPDSQRSQSLWGAIIDAAAKQESPRRNPPDDQAAQPLPVDDHIAAWCAFCADRLAAAEHNLRLNADNPDRAREEFANWAYWKWNLDQLAQENQLVSGRR
jgi:hypothetical protein